MIDCLIASVARRHQATLLAADNELSRVARIVGIDLDDASFVP
jgi:predicted nucleic acid-binding protein